MKIYQLKATNDKDLFRVVDRKGDWSHYYHKPSGKYLRSVNGILDAGYAKGQRFQEYLKLKTKEEAESILKAAGERGDRVHQAIYTLLEAGTFDKNKNTVLDDDLQLVYLNDNEWDYLITFGEFWNRHKAVWKLQELSVFNLKAGYAGTLDAVIVLMKNCDIKTCKCDKFIGKVGLVDWKTSGGIYESYGAQVAAYMNTDNLGDVKKIIEYTGIVRLGTRHKTTGGYELEIYDNPGTIEHYDEFLAAKKIHDATYVPFKEELLDVEIPEVIKLTTRK